MALHLCLRYRATDGFHRLDDILPELRFSDRVPVNWPLKLGQMLEIIWNDRSAAIVIVIVRRGFPGLRQRLGSSQAIGQVDDLILSLAGGAMANWKRRSLLHARSLIGWPRGPQRCVKRARDAQLHMRR